MIKAFSDWFVYRLLALPPGTILAGALHFFVYDTIKIFLLLAAMVFAISLVRTFFPPERTRKILSREGRYAGNLAAAALGIVTPFCSCSAVPVFLGFVEAGIPLGVTFSFLVASPMINEVALVMLWGLFGWKIAFIYVASGLGIAVISGIVIGMLKVEGLLEGLSPPAKNCCSENEGPPSMAARSVYARDYTAGILKKIWPYVLGGIGVGAWIHGYVPSDLLARYAGRGNPFAVPLAALIGIPLYSNAAGVIPMISALVEKGVGMGTALAFMMAVTALSFPEFIILRRIMKPKLIFIFAMVVGSGIIFTGYLFNFLIK